MSPILARDLDHDVWRTDHHLENADDRQLVTQAKRADRYAGMTRWAKDDHTWPPKRALPRRAHSDTAEFMRLVADFYSDPQPDEVPEAWWLIHSIEVERSRVQPWVHLVADYCHPDDDVFDLRETIRREDGAA